MGMKMKIKDEILNNPELTEEEKAKQIWNLVKSENFVLQ